jgi:ATP-dependent Clp protease adapter protein ClpS
MIENDTYMPLFDVYSATNEFGMRSLYCNFNLNGFNLKVIKHKRDDFNPRSYVTEVL